MGADQSTEARDDPLAQAVRWLGEERAERCRKKWHAISSGAPSAHVCTLVTRLGTMRVVPAPQLTWVATELSSLARQAKPVEGAPAEAHERVTEAGFLIFVASLVAPDRSARRRLFFAAATRHASSGAKATAADLETLLRCAAGKDFGSDPFFVPYLLWEALKKPHGDGSLGGVDDAIDAERFNHFLNHCPLAEALLNELFVPDDGFGGLVAPHAVKRVRGGSRSIVRPSPLLGRTAQTVLEWALPPAAQGRWELLFSSKRDGASFQRLRSCIERKGPTVLVVRDHASHVFGGFASHEWAPNSHWFGDGDCFLFSTFPELRIYRSTGVNTHFQYFNFRQETLPDGLAMGGQFDYFSLFISEAFDRGHSQGKVGSTFGNPVLSASEEFRVAEVEVWRVGPAPGALDDDLLAEERKLGILAKVADADVAVLEMAGKTMHSEGLQEPEPVDDVKVGPDGRAKRPVY